MLNNTLSFIRKQARKAAARDGYSQVIIRDRDGDYSFSRKYPGCCPEWYGEIVEVVTTQNLTKPAIVRRQLVIYKN